MAERRVVAELFLPIKKGASAPFFINCFLIIRGRSSVNALIAFWLLEAPSQAHKYARMSDNNIYY